MTTSPEAVSLRTCMREIDAHVHLLGWDRPPLLFGLARTSDLLSEGARLAGEHNDELADLLRDHPDHLTAVLQDDLPTTDVAVLLSAIEFPSTFVGAALSVERLVLPPEAEDAMPSDPDEAARWAQSHPGREDVRLVVGVTRGGERWCVIRSRAHEDEIVQGPDLVPDLAAGLQATLS